MTSTPVRPNVPKILIKVFLVAVPVLCWYLCLTILKVLPEASWGRMIFNALVILAAFSALAWEIKRHWLQIFGDLATLLLGGAILWLTLLCLGVEVTSVTWLPVAAFPFWLGGIFIRNANTRWRPLPKRPEPVFPRR